MTSRFPKAPLMENRNETRALHCTDYVPAIIHWLVSVAVTAIYVYPFVAFNRRVLLWNVPQVSEGSPPPQTIIENASLPGVVLKQRSCMIIRAARNTIGLGEEENEDPSFKGQPSVL